MAKTKLEARVKQLEAAAVCAKHGHQFKRQVSVNWNVTDCFPHPAAQFLSICDRCGEVRHNRIGPKDSGPRWRWWQLGGPSKKAYARVTMEAKAKAWDRLISYIEGSSK